MKQSYIQLFDMLAEIIHTQRYQMIWSLCCIFILRLILSLLGRYTVLVPGSPFILTQDSVEITGSTLTVNHEEDLIGKFDPKAAFTPITASRRQIDQTDKTWCVTMKAQLVAHFVVHVSA